MAHNYSGTGPHGTRTSAANPERVVFAFEIARTKICVKEMTTSSNGFRVALRLRLEQ